MATRIYYYSRSGNCARVARKYANNGEDYMVQIMDLPEDRYWGALGFIKAVFSTIFKFDLSFRMVGDNHAAVADNILITPVWMNRVPPSFRAFLQKENFDSQSRITVVTVSNSGRGKETYHQIVELLHKAGVHEISHENLKSSEV